MMLTDLPIEMYHASDFVSCSKLKTYSELGPYAYFARYIARTSFQEPKPAFALGQIIEDLAQGRPFDFSKFVVKDREFRSEAAKAWRDEHLAAGRQFVTEAELRDIRETVTAIGNNATALEVIARCEPQVTYRREYAGLPGVQARPDWAGGRVTVDLKSTSDFNAFVAGYEIRKYKYAAQAALVQYCAGGSDPMESYLLAAEKTFPFRTALVRLPDSWLAAGWAWDERNLNAVAEHYRTDTWPRTLADTAELGPYWLEEK